MVQHADPTLGLPQFVSLDDLEAYDTTNALIYGGSGNGKTFFAGTAGERTLYVNIGDGIKTLKSPLFKQKIGANPIVVNINEKLTSRGMVETATAFNMVGDTIDYALNHMSDRFDTIVLDDATALRKFAMNKGLEINQKLGKSRSLDSGKSFDLVMKAVQDYGIEMDLIEQFIASYTVIAREAGKHFIMTAHQRLTYEKQKDSKGNTLIGATPILSKVSPGFTGQTFPDNVPQYFDWVFRMEVVAGGSQGVVFRARTQPDDVHTAKCRDGGVFSVVEPNPNFLNMLQKVKDKRAEIDKKRGK